MKESSDSTPATSRPDLNLLLGLGLAVLGAICFSTKAILVKLAYRHGVDSISLLALRMGFALPVYLLIGQLLCRRRLAKLNRRDWGLLLIVGTAGYYLASLFDFLGLQYVTAGMERLILFAYPTLVVLFSALFMGQSISRRQRYALLLTYLGIGVAFLQGAQLSANPQFALGAVLVFCCAFTYSLYMIGSGYLLPKLGTVHFTTVAMSAACVAVLVHHLLQYQWQLMHFQAPVYGYAFLMSILSTVMPTFLIAEGIRRIGASNAAIVGSVGPISTIILAHLILDEQFGILQMLGTVFVIVGVLTLTLAKK